MKAEKYGGQIGRQKYMNEVGNGMIVVGNQGEGRRYCVLPVGVHFGEWRSHRMKPFAMEDIGHHLQFVSTLI